MALNLYLDTKVIDQDLGTGGIQTTGTGSGSCCTKVDNFTVLHDLSVYGTLWAYTLTHVNETVVDYSTNTLHVDGNAYIGGTLEVVGAQTFHGTTNLLGNIYTSGSFANATHFNSDVSIDGSLFINGEYFDPNASNDTDLAQDLSINDLRSWNLAQDVSIGLNTSSITDLESSVYSYNGIQDTSIGKNTNNINSLDSSVDWLYENQPDVYKDYVDGSLAVRDASITNLESSINTLINYNSIQDTSILLNTNNISDLDSSVDWIYENGLKTYLGDLQDVSIILPQDIDILSFDSSFNRWENKPSINIQENDLSFNNIDVSGNLSANEITNRSKIMYLTERWKIEEEFGGDLVFYLNGIEKFRINS